MSGDWPPSKHVALGFELRRCRGSWLVPVPAHPIDFVPSNICRERRALKRGGVYQQCSQRGRTGLGALCTHACHPEMRKGSGSFSKTGPLCPPYPLPVSDGPCGEFTLLPDYRGSGPLISVESLPLCALTSLGKSWLT